MFNQFNEQISEHLPFNERMQLVRASQTPGSTSARIDAIDEAKARISSQYPEFFQKEAS